MFYVNGVCNVLMTCLPAADLLMQALVSGKTGFAYIARVICILLQTLLQDQLAEVGTDEQYQCRLYADCLHDQKFLVSGLALCRVNVAHMCIIRLLV